MESIYLAGSEDVRRASSEMSTAAETMRRAAGDFAFQVDRLERLWQEVSCRLDDAALSPKEPTQ